MRVWIDVTNSPHVVFFQPLVELLRDRGHEVTISARAFAQTLELLDDAGLGHTVVGPPHGGASRAAKIRAMGARLRALRRFAGGRGFDVALSHASHELPLAARSLGIRSAYAFDYEFALAQHALGCRAATRVVVPDAIPQGRLDRLAVHRPPGRDDEIGERDQAPRVDRARGHDERGKGKSPDRVALFSCAWKDDRLHV
jgi:predicted glycosyltransferase